MTNQEFAKNDKRFRIACGDAKVDPTRRQASKFQNGLGLAYKKYNHLRDTSPRRVFHDSPDQLKRRRWADLHQGILLFAKICQGY